MSASFGSASQVSALHLDAPATKLQLVTGLQEVPPPGSMKVLGKHKSASLFFLPFSLNVSCLNISFLFITQDSSGRSNEQSGEITY